jgi:tRNA C32,U32 (ribose-2'-O)-methylase TrmJ
VNIPTGQAYSSLNLAMAVQVLSYEILQAKLAKDAAPQQSAPSVGVAGQDESWDMDFAQSQAVEMMMEHLEQTLIEVDFHDPENPRQLMTRLRRMFNRIRMDKMEVNILRGFLTAINRKGRN